MSALGQSRTKQVCAYYVPLYLYKRTSGGGGRGLFWRYLFTGRADFGPAVPDPLARPLISSPVNFCSALSRQTKLSIFTTEHGCEWE